MKSTLFHSEQAAGRATEGKGRLFFILLEDWTWWVWSLTALLLAIGLGGYPGAFAAALGLAGVQTILILVRERSFAAFPVQLRFAYFVLLALCSIPWMRWLYWLPTVGTLALVTFGYCPMARALYLLPWNRQEPFSSDLMLRAFLSRPDLVRLAAYGCAAGCAGGLCTIDAQIRRSPRPAVD